MWWRKWWRRLKKLLLLHHQDEVKWEADLCKTKYCFQDQSDWESHVVHTHRCTRVGAALWPCCAYRAALHTGCSLTPRPLAALNFSNRDYVKRPLTWAKCVVTSWWSMFAVSNVKRELSALLVPFSPCMNFNLSHLMMQLEEYHNDLLLVARY